ncbi:hypothetical protein [Methylorubrum extorquens]|uniref:hypothetical protein n=1 Tax=Methylorubrum extorquens TaxID=408 RepID=UPI000158F5D9|nr:hypothetical protein [Methylorubrum extorquens]ABY32075.1 hypothetical protein Mext_3699 [Methylorubrum extorquens PA1]KQP95204.1 hypothetical protein ASF55_16455 [Methylobacterium sp. Leaf119]WIU38682.1 hypothetical protein KQ926_19095 [Methylorubrum extorquens]
MCQRAPKVSYSRASSPIEHFDTETFELSRDPAFVNKVRDVHGLYPNLERFRFGLSRLGEVHRAFAG